MRFIIIFLLAFMLDARMINDFSQSEKNKYLKHLKEQSPQHINWVNETFLSLAVLIDENIAAEVFERKNIKISDFKPLFKSVKFKGDWLYAPDGTACIKISLNDDFLELSRAKKPSAVCLDSLNYYKIKRKYCADNLENQHRIKSDLHFAKTGDFLDELDDYSSCFKRDLSKDTAQIYRLDELFYSSLSANFHRDLKTYKDEGAEFNFAQIPSDCAVYENGSIKLRKNFANSSQPAICAAFSSSARLLYKDSLLIEN